MPWTGMEMTSRTVLMTVIIPTYKSPPVFWSMALYMTWTELLVMDMVKPLIPRPMIRRTLDLFSFIQFFFSFKIAFGPVRNFKIQMAEISWDKIVASAAPRTPM